MPSLRRSFSSPSVRSSPYPSSLSALSPSAPRSRPPVQPRRSSGSATAERRVLADIEWWRVCDGQCDLDLPDPAHDNVQASDGDVPPGGTVTLSAADGSLEPPQTSLGFLPHSMQFLPPEPLAALSIAPYFPTDSRHGRDSSVESTPELSTAPLESVQLGLGSPPSSLFSDHVPFSLPLTRAGGRQVHPLFGLRSVSAPGLSHQGSLEPDFADMGGDLFSFDQNLFQ